MIMAIVCCWTMGRNAFASKAFPIPCSVGISAPPSCPMTGICMTKFWEFPCGGGYAGNAEICSTQQANRGNIAPPAPPFGLKDKKRSGAEENRGNRRNFTPRKALFYGPYSRCFCVLRPFILKHEKCGEKVSLTLMKTLLSDFLNKMKG